MSERHECHLDFKHDTCVCAKCGEPFVIADKLMCKGAQVIERPVAPAPTASAGPIISVECSCCGSLLIFKRNGDKLTVFHDCLSGKKAREVYARAEAAEACVSEKLAGVGQQAAEEYLRARYGEELYSAPDMQELIRQTEETIAEIFDRVIAGRVKP